MAGLGPAIHGLATSEQQKSWIPGPGPGMTGHQDIPSSTILPMAVILRCPASGRASKDADLSAPSTTILRGSLRSHLRMTVPLESQPLPHRHHYSTVTDFARLRGWSTSVPITTAVW